MNTTDSLVAPLPRVSRRGIDDALAAWRGFASEQLVGAALLAAISVFPKLQSLIVGSVTTGHGLNTAWPVALQMILVALINAYSLLLAVMLADRAVDRGAARLPAYATAVLTGIGAGTAAGWLLNTFVIGALLPITGVFAEKLRINPRVVFTVGASVWFEWITLGALATFVYADRREVRRIAAKLRAVQDERLARVRRQLESDLLAMQARVEPQFLFDTLGDVERLYETDPPSAALMLDSLIAFLRAAMPQVRETTSTLEQELDLAFAYLSIQGIRSGTPVHCEAQLPDELRAARMPPMILVPLLDQAMLLQTDDGTGGAAVRVAATARDGQLEIAIEVRCCRCVPKAAAEGMSVLRKRLSALYETGAEASVSGMGRHAAQARLAIPIEATPASAIRE